MNLRNPLVVGFGIADHPSFEHALQYADAAIVGSAFVRLLDDPYDHNQIPAFIEGIRDGVTA